MKTTIITISVCSVLFLVACADEVPPVSVTEFMERPRLLEATMVRCGQNRSAMKYEVECVNARDAVNRLASAEKQEKRHSMEAQSERKRQALRRTQQAAADARRRVLEAQRAREEAEYLGLFEQLPDAGGTAGQPQPQAVEQPSPQDGSMAEAPAPDAATAGNGNTVNTDSVVAEAETNMPAESDLNSIREELRRHKAIQE